MYEDCHHENRQLSQDIHSVKLQLEKVKHQLEVAAQVEMVLTRSQVKLENLEIIFRCLDLQTRLIFQASALIPATANMKYDKKNMERKLLEIRNELKVRKQMI